MGQLVEGTRPGSHDPLDAYVQNLKKKSALENSGLIKKTTLNFTRMIERKLAANISFALQKMLLVLGVHVADPQIILRAFCCPQFQAVALAEGKLHCWPSPRLGTLALNATRQA